MYANRRAMNTIGFRIEAKHFCAGGELEGAVVTRAAPIIAYMIGWDAHKVRRYCDRKNWRVEKV